MGGGMVGVEGGWWVVGCRVWGAGGGGGWGGPGGKGPGGGGGGGLGGGGETGGVGGGGGGGGGCQALSNVGSRLEIHHTSPDTAGYRSGGLKRLKLSKMSLIIGPCSSSEWRNCKTTG